MKSQVVILKNKVPQVRRAVSGEALGKAALAGAFVIEGFAKLNAGAGRPKLNVDTGNLRNSINTQLDETTATSATASVGTGVIYAAIHEFGGIVQQGQRIINIPARPYMRPAVDEHRDAITETVKATIKRLIESAV